ncbi:hypothetical protein SCHIN_v1c10390 [Spiroplasma chinense]|uniref:Uncharacterized protein n=1 Tax=Spiroplasma chinense TaxID=216932 RepID=A0A5B9Y818_9MOLU|nr:hypothetical protein [Spiroplasma chinense]QEH62232.1 hypothetical protein SCHIN_v1c10390 [Spiroplasma chinense]
MSDLKEKQNLLSDDAKKRLEEIKRSDDLVKANSATNYFVPKRKVVEEQVISEAHEVIKPRKRKNLPFSEDEKTHIKEVVEEVKQELKTREVTLQKDQKKLFKEGHKISKMVSKVNKKIEVMKTKGYDEEVIERTLELKEDYVNKLKQIHEEIEVINSSYDPNMSLKDRRRQIYNNAYSAETERARKLIKNAGSNKMSWSDHKNDSDFVQPDKDAYLPERKRTKSWEEEVEDID